MFKMYLYKCEMNVLWMYFITLMLDDEPMMFEVKGQGSEWSELTWGECEELRDSSERGGWLRRVEAV